MPHHLILSLHDVHPHSLPFIQDQRQTLHRLGIQPCVQLVVPHYHHRSPCDHSQSLIEYLRACQDHGDEIVLHGYYHDRRGFKTTPLNFFWTRLYTNAEAEFLDIPEPLAEKRFLQGRAMLEALGLHIHGFIAPAWLLHSRCLPILARLGFQYTTTLREIMPLSSQKKLVPIPAQSLCWSVRSLWRRPLSLLWNAYLYPRAAKSSVLRIALHPYDFLYPPIKNQILSLIKQAIASGFQPTSYQALIQSLAA